MAAKDPTGRSGSFFAQKALDKASRMPCPTNATRMEKESEIELRHMTKRVIVIRFPQGDLVIK